MAWHGTAWHGMAWHGMAWHDMAWHGRDFFLEIEGISVHPQYNQAKNRNVVKKII
jgi:hypothetical protein